VSHITRQLSFPESAEKFLIPSRTLDGAVAANEAALVSADKDVAAPILKIFRRYMGHILSCKILAGPGFPTASGSIGGDVEACGFVMVRCEVIAPRGQNAVHF
jgi:hypothetical protein